MALQMLSSNNKLILLYKTMEQPAKSSKYDVMLSPEFYIIKKEELPIKYSYKAKKVAPSILDDILQGSDEYEIIPIKDGNKWSFIAYSPRKVEEFLKGYNIKPENIANVYFSDQIVTKLNNKAINLDEKALTSIDGYATIVPKSMLHTNEIINFTKNFRPSRGFKFKSSSHLNSSNNTINKGAIALGVIFALLGAAFAIEALTYKKAIIINKDKLAAIYEENQALSSAMTRDSIRKKYENKEIKQRAIREAIKKYSELVNKESTLNNLEIKDNLITATFNVTPKEIKHFKATALSKDLNIKQNGNKILIEEKL